MGAATAGGGPSDDQFNRVSFLSHFEGSNNGVNNAFDDGSASNHTITANGNVTQGSFGPFAKPDGEWGVRFPQNHPHYIDIPSSSDFAIASDADYTFEFFVFYDTKDSDHIIMDYRTGGANGTFPVLGIAGDLNYDESDGSADTGKVSFNPHSGTLSSVKSASTLTFGAWNHVAIVRNSGTINFYINGTRDNNSYTNNTTVATAANIRFGDLALNSDAGADGNNSYYPGLQFSGVLSNFRFVNGTAVYSGSSITVPTSKLTAITNTKLLLFQSNRFVDNSSSGHTVPVSAGSPAVTAFGPFLTSAVYDPAVNGASGYFDGSGDYLSIANSSDFNLAANDFCFEFWFWGDSLAQYDTILSLYNTWAIEQESSGGGIKIAMWISSGSSGSWDLLSAGIMSNLLKVNEWNHLVIARTGNTLKSYHNGAIVYNSSFSGTIGSSSNVLYSGTFDTSAYWWDGYISDVKLSNGSTGGINVSGNTITVPTAPLAVTDSYTKLLLNMADGQAIDSAAQNNLNLFGTAKTSTAQYKFGTASLLLDGNSDYATFPENGANDIDGGGNWTVEFFWRFVNKTSPAYQELITKGTGFQIYTSSGSLSLALSSNNSSYDIANATGGTTLDNDVWYHLALVKNGTSYKLYLNGTSDLSVTSSSNLDTGGFPWFLGTLRTAETTYPSNGYMDEVRISKFARYTSNFTAPTEPFADKGQ